jgi:hypothetical protein
MKSDATIGAVFARSGRWLCAAALVAYALVVVIPAARNPHTNGFAAYYTASRILVEAPRDLPRAYDDVWFQRRIDSYGFPHVLDVLYVQPPTISLIMAPFARLSPERARVVWIGASVACWLGGVAVLSAMFGPPMLPLIALTTLYLPLADNLWQGQGYALLFLLLCLTLRLATRSDFRGMWLAGIPLGLMLVLKGAGIWLWPLFLVAKRWRIVAGAGVTALAVAVAAAPVIGWSAWRPFFDDIPRLVTEPIRYVTAYQTVTSLFGHLFVFDARWNPAPVVHLPGLARALTIAVTAASLFVSLRLQRFAAGDRDEQALSAGMFVALGACMSPVAESHHYLLVLPAVVAAVAVASRRRVPGRSWLVLAAGTLLLVIPRRFYLSDRLQAGWLAVLAYPKVYGALSLWGWMAASLRDGTARAADRGDR